MPTRLAASRHVDILGLVYQTVLMVLDTTVRPQLRDRQTWPRSSLVADVLDALGHRHQCLPAELAALQPGDKLCGRAYPVQAVEIDYVPEVPYVGLLKALNGITSGEVFVLATGRSDAAAGWGELLSTACQAAGAVGALVDAPTRDVDLIAELGFAVFARGRRPNDCHGRLEIASTGQPVQIGEVMVHPGDLVIGDADGVVVVPRAITGQVLEAAFDKGERESEFRSAVAQGMKPSEAYAKFGVL